MCVTLFKLDPRPVCIPGTSVWGPWSLCKVNIGKGVLPNPEGVWPQDVIPCLSTRCPKLYFFLWVKTTNGCVMGGPGRLAQYTGRFFLLAGLLGDILITPLTLPWERARTGSREHVDTERTGKPDLPPSRPAFAGLLPGGRHGRTGKAGSRTHAKLLLSHGSSTLDRTSGLQTPDGQPEPLGAPPSTPASSPTGPPARLTGV